MSEGGMVVGRYSAETASLTFSNGTVNVSSGDVIIGQMAGSSGRLTITNAATLNIGRDMYVGGSFFGNGGSGRLVINDSNAAVNVTGALNVLSNGTVSFNAGSLSVGTLNLSANARVELASGGNKVLRTKWVNVGSGAKIDLTDNDMIVSDEPIAMVKSFIVSGFANGAWNGTGLISSLAAADTRFGYGQANTLGLNSFDGVPVSGANVLVKYTYAGDANLDGKVDKTDLGLLALGWNSSGFWTSGDFNYDGLINVSDFKLLADNWLKGISAPLSEPLSLALAMASFGLTDVTAVPEPTGWIAAGAGMLLMARRRQRLIAMKSVDNHPPGQKN
jgi:hypothetical protein